MFNKVFIAHAKEDAAVARELYNHFNISTPFKPWLDKVDLLPGNNWRDEIGQALRHADFIIVLFSKIAVAKTGYVQKEFKLALDYCDERPEDSIYIIPVLVDNCVIPEKFAKYQWVSLGDWDAYNQIHSALRKQRDIYVQREMSKVAQDLSYEYGIETIDETIGTKVFHKINITYPQFIKTSIKALVHLNAYILADVYRMYNDFLKISCPDEPNGNPHHPGNELGTIYNFELITTEFISLTVYSSSYTGGAHGQYGTLGMNFQLQPLMKIELEELLDYFTENLKAVAFLCKEKLLQRALQVFEIDNEEEFFLHRIEDNLNWDLFRNFYVGDQTLTFIFVPYQLTARAYGQHEIIITFDELRSACGSLSGLDRLSSLLN
ncbi:TIR domain-containing protein [Mucilaginibacter sp. ZT4R22]|uniref:TIR domain-containing protein n=1 Tax=Mucilaginibacter pankratovii TaxID=2772110 RepID=A0ABR7WSV7_9SPHI|nr:TIR domain-containing protein [Mucilaginibacter pankratovii]MBD1365386.1 TIR domain-containing protein [Mucilaginibacter pankratovii]